MKCFRFLINFICIRFSANSFVVVVLHDEMDLLNLTKCLNNLCRGICVDSRPKAKKDYFCITNIDTFCTTFAQLVQFLTALETQFGFD